MHRFYYVDIKENSNNKSITVKDFKGIESVNTSHYISVPELEFDYYRLNWNGDKAIKAFADEKGL